MTTQPTLPADQPPQTVPAGLLAEARAQELEEALTAAQNRAVVLNVELRLRDAKIAQLEAELAKHNTTATEEN